MDKRIRGALAVVLFWAWVSSGLWNLNLFYGGLAFMVAIILSAMVYELARFDG